eukprot:873546-Pyramimonas_sp.AAC.1
MDEILRALRLCRDSLHSWGHANGVSFDASKESCHVLSNTRPYGESFTILGILFDTKLLMRDAVHECAYVR